MAYLLVFNHQGWFVSLSTYFTKLYRKTKFYYLSKQKYFLNLSTKYLFKPNPMENKNVDRITSSGINGIIFNGISDWTYKGNIIKNLAEE